MLENNGWPPRMVRGDGDEASQPSIASLLNQTDKGPHCGRAASCSAKFVTPAPLERYNDLR
jgi:hypothetical protein